MIGLASDHAGFAYKEQIKRLLAEWKLPFRDFGTDSEASTDYPDWGHLAAQAISSGECTQAILVCGTGIGMSMIANKHKGVRAAVCESSTAAQLARKHNDANVLCIGQRLIGWDTALDIIETFLETVFEGERHQRRVTKIHSLTNL